MRLTSGARNALIALGAVVALVLGAGIVWAVGREGDSGTLAKATETTATTAAAVELDESTIATTTGAPIDVYTEPVAGSAVQTTLSPITEYQIPRTMLVIDEQPAEADAPEWLQVLLPMRPNGSTGWIEASSVTLSTTTYEIRIELGAHKLTLLNDDEVVFETQTVNGKESTPTPLGQYYVTDPVDLQDRPTGAYGAYALGISGYSDVLLEFNGGPGQIAVHGTTETSLLGQDASNGCIRVDNESILQIANAVPVGTPVTIVA
ncbi:MAG: L,D-transpeptidase [Acidimicrobiia bacterium]